MRADKDNREQRYYDFWDWLRADWHPMWIIAILLGYLYYLQTTYEV